MKRVGGLFESNVTLLGCAATWWLIQKQTHSFIVSNVRFYGQE